MATTTATITLASTDLLSDELALTTSATLTGAGNSTGLTGTGGLARKTVSGGHAQYTLFDGSDYTADKAHKLYLKNTSTTAAEYFLITVNSEDVGRLYAGDWALIPWSAHDNDNDIKIDPSANDMTLEYMLFTDD
jgi:hypothetical protein|tara:strand:- start:160 stop:564 length:405 start_codon:yes stop_codon:yes gene_type:complete